MEVLSESSIFSVVAVKTICTLHTENHLVLLVVLLGSGRTSTLLSMKCWFIFEALSSHRQFKFCGVTETTTTASYGGALPHCLAGCDH